MELLMQLENPPIVASSAAILHSTSLLYAGTSLWSCICHLRQRCLIRHRKVASPQAILLQWRRYSYPDHGPMESGLVGVREAMKIICHSCLKIVGRRVGRGRYEGLADSRQPPRIIKISP